MVLRPWEEEDMSRHEAFRRDYALMKVFDATGLLEEYREMPGLGYLLGDAVFKVYKRCPRPLAT